MHIFHHDTSKQGLIVKLWYIPAGIEVSFLMDEGRETDVEIEIGI